MLIRTTVTYTRHGLLGSKLVNNPAGVKVKESVQTDKTIEVDKEKNQNYISFAIACRCLRTCKCKEKMELYCNIRNLDEERLVGRFFKGHYLARKQNVALKRDGRAL